MQIPRLGPVTEDDVERYRTDQPVPVPVLGGGRFHVFLDGYDDDPDRDETHAVIGAFLDLDASVLRAAAPAVYDYYLDTVVDLRAAGLEVPVRIGGPDEVFDHVRFGEITVVRDGAEGDGPVYVSIECECAWEPEHGLQIVFREGRSVTKVGPYDGELTTDGDTPSGSPYARRTGNVGAL
jgi:hypothetical protein